MATTPPPAPLTPLFDDHFELKPKQIYRSPNFRDHTGLAGTEPFASNLLEFVRRIEQGHELPPKFYRNGIGQTPDDLLAHTGIKHIHLGTVKTDVLLFVQEFDDIVVLLEIADHRSNFHQVPVGATLTKNHIASVQAQVPGWAATAAQAAAAIKRATRIAAAGGRARILTKKTPKP